MKIYYPSEKIMAGSSKVMYDYLLHGFKNIGEVIINENLNKESRNYVKPDNPNHILAIDIELDKKYRVWWDFSDFHHYHPEIRQKGDFYFKIHFLKEYNKIPRTYPIGQILGDMRYITENKNLLKLSNNEPEHDLIAIYRTTSYDIRLKTVELLKASRFNCLCGLIDFNAGKIRPYSPKKHAIKRIPSDVYMQMLAKSKFIFALPGVDNSRSWRHAEGWSLKKPLLALDLDSQNPGNYQECYIKVKNDLSDLLEKLEYYDKNYDEALKIAEKGHQYFKKYLSPVAMAQNIIKTIEKEI